MTLVAVGTHRCPTCLQPTQRQTVDQTALFFHGGYGATLHIATVWCPRCGWEIVTDISETRP